MNFKALPHRRFRLTESAAMSFGDPQAGLRLEVPAGFEFDVSVPWFLRWLFDPMDPRFLDAALFHDYALCQGWPKEAAAAPFGLVLRTAGVGRYQRLVMVLAVIIWRWR